MAQCTDAVSVDVEERLYELASRFGVTVITVSQREALTKYHAEELVLQGNGAWELRSKLAEA